MSKENINKIKSYIDDVLGTNSSLRDKLPSRISQKKKLFCEIIQNLQFANARTMSMKHDFKINVEDYQKYFFHLVTSNYKIKHVDFLCLYI